MEHATFTPAPLHHAVIPQLIGHHHDAGQRVRSARLDRLMRRTHVVGRSHPQVAGAPIDARTTDMLNETFVLEDASIRVVTLDLAAESRALREQVREVVGWTGSVASRREHPPGAGFEPSISPLGHGLSRTVGLVHAPADQGPEQG